MLTIKEGKPEVDDCSEESDQSVGRADMHESTTKLHPPGNLGNFHKIAAQHITAASGKKNSVRDLTDNYATAGKQESRQL
jgi:hypothetical protein